MKDELTFLVLVFGLFVELLDNNRSLIRMVGGGV